MFSQFFRFLNANKDAFAAVQSIGTVFGVMIAGWWAWMTFRRRRLRFPRANIQHTIYAWEISRGRWHVHVSINIRNEGEVLLQIREGCMWAQQVDPCPEHLMKIIEAGNDPVIADSTEVEWPLAGTKRQFQFRPPREIEPGESDELHSDIFISEPINRILIYTYFSNTSKTRGKANSSKPRGRRFWEPREIGWNNSTFYDIPHKVIT